MTKYTAALIGTGRIGFLLGFDKKREQPASHTMALLANKRIDLAAATDTDSDRLALWEKHVKGGRTYSNSDELYKNEKPDIITVAVNEAAHLTECVAAIEARPRLVILEKPVALNSAEAEKISAAAERCKVPVMVNHERRFSADYLAAKNFMTKIGEIQSVRGELLSGLRVYSKEKEISGEYSLLHDGTHLVDIMSFLLGEKLTSPTLSSMYKDDKGDVRNFTAFFKSESCPSVSLTMSGRSKFFAFGVDILGTLGRICVGNGYAKFYLRKESKLYSGFYSLTSEKVRLPKKTGYFSGMIQNAVDFLDGKSELKSPLQVAIDDLKSLEEIKELIK